jgi:hypothetical protein
MNLEDIESKLPNGFHDAQLNSLNIDYSNQKAVLDITVWTSDLDSKDPELRETYRLGKLTINNLLFCIIEPPDSNYYPYHENGSVTIDAGPFDSIPNPPQMPSLKPLPKEAFVHYFYVSDWNSLIYIAGMDAQFDWQ